MAVMVVVVVVVSAVTAMVVALVLVELWQVVLVSMVAAVLVAPRPGRVLAVPQATLLVEAHCRRCLGRLLIIWPGAL